MRHTQWSGCPNGPSSAAQSSVALLRSVRGGQKTVFAGVHADYGSVVVKVVTSDQADARVWREVEVMKACSLPHTARLYEWGEETFGEVTQPASQSRNRLGDRRSGKCSADRGVLTGHRSVEVGLHAPRDCGGHGDTWHCASRHQAREHNRLGSDGVFTFVGFRHCAPPRH